MASGASAQWKHTDDGQGEGAASYDQGAAASWSLERSTCRAPRVPASRRAPLPEAGTPAPATPQVAQQAAILPWDDTACRPGSRRGPRTHLPVEEPTVLRCEHQPLGRLIPPADSPSRPGHRHASAGRRLQPGPSRRPRPRRRWPSPCPGIREPWTWRSRSMRACRVALTFAAAPLLFPYIPTPTPRPAAPHPAPGHVCSIPPRATSCRDCAHRGAR